MASSDDSGVSRTSMRKKLDAAHKGLLDLHKALIDHENIIYQQSHGSITRGEWLQLLLTDKQFAWLKVFSDLIIKIDEATAAKVDDRTFIDEGDRLLDEARRIVSASGDSEFHQRFNLFVNESPQAFAAKSELQSILN
jgi:hypothetical protein